MMSSAHFDHLNRDPLGCTEELRFALARSELDVFDTDAVAAEDHRRAALWLAVTLGRCRLFGVDPGEFDRVLPPRIAVAAAEQCSADLREWSKTFQEFVNDWNTETVDMGDELEAGDFLFARMDFWAAAIAIDEALDRALRANDLLYHELARGVTTVLDHGRALDNMMQSHCDVICIAATTQMLKNWRALLAEPYRIALPWWLDGTLEDAWGRINEVAGASQPDRLVPIIHLESRGEGMWWPVRPLLCHADQYPKCELKVYIEYLHTERNGRLRVSIRDFWEIKPRSITLRCRTAEGQEKFAETSKQCLPPNGVTFEVACSPMQPGDTLLIRLRVNGEDVSLVPLMFP